MPPRKKPSGINAGDNSIVISGSVQGSNIVMGNNNRVSNQSVNLAPLFENVYRNLDIRTDLNPGEKKDIKDELQEIQATLETPAPDENFLTRRFRNLKRMAPDIVDVVFETLKNPVSGVATVMQKIAKKMAE